MGLMTSRIMAAVRKCGPAAIIALVVSGAHAGGIDRIDHEVALDQSGIWDRNVQLALEYAVIATEGCVGLAW
ncbi:hypothetical protein [Paraburkholderia franconis]|uniref:hypothetical protein n=1 Tax=Paraburkholderia franconis TaxID=2654983 RepID=UPI001D0FE4D2|nr:hypothetical protein [Paraburkholderia franconis]